MIVGLQLAVGRRHVLMTSGRPTNAANAKVARKVMERTWNDSTIVDNRRKNRSVCAVAPVRADALWPVLTCITQ